MDGVLMKNLEVQLVRPPVPVRRATTGNGFACPARYRALAVFTHNVYSFLVSCTQIWQSKKSCSLLICSFSSIYFCFLKRLTVLKYRLTAALPVCEIPGDHPSEKESEAHVRFFKPTIESAVMYHRKNFTVNYDTFLFSHYPISTSGNII